MVETYTCEQCGFVCYNEKLYLQHRNRESLLLTERQEKINNREKRKEIQKRFGIRID
jgi:uncharacterized C2H2 Zn-finger protein